MTRKLIQIFFVVLSTGLSLNTTAGERRDLNGTWKLDVKASQFGNMPPLESGVLTISTSPHKTFHLTLETKSSHEERTEESAWIVDDRYHPVEGGSSGEVLAKWEGSVLVGKRVADSGMQEIRLRLAHGSEALTEHIQSGINVTTLIWIRE